MTEEQIQAWAKWLFEESGLSVRISEEDKSIIQDFLRILASEAQKQGIDKMRDRILHRYMSSTSNEGVPLLSEKAIREEAEGLKEKG